MGEEEEGSTFRVGEYMNKRQKQDKEVNKNKKHLLIE
jgi:hypothetical protein